jgi:hypothetical protein
MSSLKSLLIGCRSPSSALPGTLLRTRPHVRAAEVRRDAREVRSDRREVRHDKREVARDQ